MTAGVIQAALVASTPTAIAAAPTFVATGTLQAGTGGLTYSWATGGIDTSYVDNDIAFAIIQTSNQTPPNTPSGWTYLTSTGSGTAAAALSVGLHMAWARCNGTMGNPSFGDSGDHTMGRIILIRGCKTSGTPVALLGTPDADSQSEPIPIPVGDTTADLSLVMHVMAHGQDNANTWVTSVTSASLVSVTAAFTANGTLQGNGGGIAAYYGVKTAAGSLGSPTADLTSVSQPVVVARATVAFLPMGA